MTPLRAATRLHAGVSPTGGTPAEASTAESTPASCVVDGPGERAQPVPRRAGVAKILAIVVAANLVVGGVLFLARTPTAPSRASAAPPALPAQVRELQATIEAGQHGEGYELVLSDAELTDTGARALAASPYLDGLLRLNLAASARDRQAIGPAVRWALTERFGGRVIV